MKIIYITALALFAGITAYAQNRAVGYVYADVNKNGIKDRAEKGVANVAVTNGQEVVLTNARGYYELPVGNDNIIAVIKPSNYSVPKNTDNLPQYFYIHKPQGSPAQLKYKGVEPTGALPKSVDFALIPAKEPLNFTALVFGDPQVYSVEQIEFLKSSIINEVKGVKNVAFGLSMGDEVGEKLNLFAPYTQAMREIGVPWYNVIGNHDMNMDVPADSLSDESFEAHFGPDNYAFNYGKVHFIVLDDVLYPDPRDGHGYYGGLRQDQLKFVQNDLKYVPKDYLVILAFHIPLSEPQFLFRSADRVSLFDMLKDFPHTLSLSAHTHMQRQDIYTKGTEWKQDKPHQHFNIGTASGDWYSGLIDKEGIPVSTMRDGTPRGYGFIRCSGNEYVIDYKVAGIDAAKQMRIMLPPNISSTADTAANIFVDFFTGEKNSKVLYKIDNGEYKPMEYTIDFNPFYLAEVAEWKSITDKTKKARRPSNPAKSNHLWKVTLPKGLSAGKHTIEVKATDLFNRTFTQNQTFEVK